MEPGKCAPSSKILRVRAAKLPESCGWTDEWPGAPANPSRAVLDSGSAASSTGQDPALCQGSVWAGGLQRELQP